VVQPRLVLGLGETILHRPAGARHGDQLGQRRAARRVAAEVRQLPLALLGQVQRPANQQEMTAAGGIGQRPVIQPRPLRAVRARRSPGSRRRGRLMDVITAAAATTTG